MKTEELLSSLIAVVMQDGGHHKDEVGLEQAARDAESEVIALRSQRNDYMGWHTQQGQEIARLRAELQRVKDLAKQAQEKLQATQYNWMEECLFECNDLLDEINPLPFTSHDPTPVTEEEIKAGG